MNKRCIVSLVLIIAIIVLGILVIKNRTIENVAFSSNKIKIVTSFYPLYFFTREIAGDKAVVTNITPAGVEPHDYELTAQDMTQIENSDVLVLNGGPLESWSAKVKNNLESKKVIITTVGDGLIIQNDPHIWLSPILANKIVEKITDTLKSADPVNVDYYESNANSLKLELSNLDKQYLDGLSSCANRNIVTSHSAFGYLASAYNLKQVSIAGLSPDTEPSSKELVKIAKFAKDNNVDYIFFESLVSPKLSETIATEIGAQTLVLNPIEGLTEEDIMNGKTYITEMKDNLLNLQKALQCKK